MDLRAAPPDTTSPALQDTPAPLTQVAVGPAGGYVAGAGREIVEDGGSGTGCGEDNCQDDSVDDSSMVSTEHELALLDEHALRQLLRTQPVIEQAKGLLMGCYRLDSAQAFALLRRWSSHSHIKIRDLATQLVDSAAQPGPAPFHPAQISTSTRPDNR